MRKGSALERCQSHLFFSNRLECAINQSKSANETWLVVSDHDPYKVFIQSHAPPNRIKVRSLDTLADTTQCSNVQHAIVELWLLSKCRHILMTEWSSFGWLASSMSGAHPTIVSKSSCHTQPFARPCFYELTHVQQLSCYDHDTMLKEDGCCLSEGLCHTVCLHHESKGGSHSFYFLLVWPSLPLLRWLLKWSTILFILTLALNRMMIKMSRTSLLSFYRTALGFILLACIAYIDIRCLVWSFIKVL